MALLNLWEADRKEIERKLVHQIIAIAGSGKLQDGNETSREFREFLSHVPSTMLEAYAQHCLTEKFDASGLALQDVINEVGRRLGFRVENGRYRGTPGQSGHDGLWHLPEGESIVVEVKTTDAYRIDLDAVAEYRRLLSEAKQIALGNSSILIVVGRQDTGDVEVQIRGSRHAWDMRLISVDALLRLMSLKEEVEDPQILRKITGILVPQEFTRVDGIIDLVFSAAEDVLQGDEIADEDEETTRPSEGQRRTPQFIPAKFHDACVERIKKQLKIPLVRQTRATYATPDGTVSLVCMVSREPHSAGQSYWYAFHPHQKDRLLEAKEAYVAFGCGSEETVLLIPFHDFLKWVDGMNVTHRRDRYYWHVHIFREGKKLVLHLKSGFGKVDLTAYLLQS